MSASTSPKPDAPVAATGHPLLWVLVQVEPRVAVLAISADRERIAAEGRVLAGAHDDSGDPTYLRLLIKPCDQVLV